MPAGTHNYYKNKEQGKPKVGTKVPLSYLDGSVGDVRYSIILRPVKTEPIEFSNMFNQTGVPVTKEDGSVDSTQAEKTKQAANDRYENAAKDLSTKLQAKLRTSSDLKNTAGSFISLPLPVALRDGLNLQYSQSDLGSMGAGLQFGQEVYQSYQDSGSVVGALSTGVKTGGEYILRSLLSVSDAASAFLQKKFGNIPNPFSVTLFEKVQLRTFNFEWILQPKSPEEAARLREIINLIRYYSLPDVDGLFIKVPHEWEIAFLGTDKLFCFSRCVLENMEVNYSVNGFPVFMEDDAPQTVSLTITFKEIYPMNKQTVLNGPESMKPNMNYTFEEDQEAKEGSQENTVSQNSVFDARSETEKELKQFVDEWLSQSNKLFSLRDEKDTALRAREPDPNRIANINAQINAVETSMNLIKTEVDSIHLKLGGTDSTGRKLKSLPYADLVTR